MCKAIWKKQNTMQDLETLQCEHHMWRGITASWKKCGNEGRYYPTHFGDDPGQTDYHSSVLYSRALGDTQDQNSEGQKTIGFNYRSTNESVQPLSKHAVFMLSGWASGLMWASIRSTVLTTSYTMTILSYKQIYWCSHRWYFLSTLILLNSLCSGDLHKKQCSLNDLPQNKHGQTNPSISCCHRIRKSRFRR